MSRHPPHYLPAMALLACLAAPVNGQAQEPPSSPHLLPPIEVSGGKRTQDLQDVDGTVMVEEAESLAARGITAVDQLDRVFPDTLIRPRSSTAYSNLTMRGQTSSDFYNPSVLVLVDGVPQDFALASQLLPLQLDHVEALYGPQGTLYGAGAVGGVLNIVTRRPEDRWSATLTGGLSNRQRESGVLLNAPLVPGALFGDLALSTRQEVGRYRDANGSDDLGGNRDATGQVRLRYAPAGSPWDVMLSAARAIRNSAEEQYVLGSQLGDRKALPYDSHYRLATTSLGLNASYDLGGATIASITHWQDRDLNRTIQGYYSPEAQKTFGQELRLASSPGHGRALDYVAGLYYQHVDFERRIPGQVSRQTLQSYALYGETIWHVTDRLDITTGLRFDVIDTEASAHGFVDLRGGRQDAALSPKIALGYRLTDELRAFALYSSGFKSGGFTRTVTPYNFAYDFSHARTDNLEAGLRGRFLGGRFEASASGYYSYTHGYQAFIGTQPIQYLQNVGDVESYGLNLSASAWLTRSLRLAGGLGLNHTEFVSYRDPTGTGADYKGHAPAYAPKITGRLEASYVIDLPGEWGQLLPRAGLSHIGKTFYDEANTVSQGAYTLFDAGLSWQAADKLAVHVYANNLTDQRYTTYGFATGTVLGNAYQLGAGREVGFRVVKGF
ncbi:TonB-dependent receptor [Roseomonas sp. GC11]|uniref:TonB-dependent receptor n=1 Tax=Roseomonas sp. GC11 TaxID=2950546 RepID=UPI00210ECEB2|nr:TonB-dependent receptor [Roseomonas sp. GC11]MCQ4160532.1 TonB-dependent receptor [Roseomonas sp. GC11]